MQKPCEDCCGISRRNFLKTTIAGTAVAAAGSLPAFAEKSGWLANTPGQPETLVATLFKSLNEKQRNEIAFAFDHPLRSKVDNNWNITKPTLGTDFFTKDQREMVREIFMNLPNI